MTPAYAKVNLALVVGPLREDGKHEVATVLTRIDLHDDITLEAAEDLVVDGFREDTTLRDSLESLARAAGVEPQWRARIDKRIPVAAGLGGGSSDAATALELANATLSEPLSGARLHEVAKGIGADVPFFLQRGPCVGTGDGTELRRVELPTDFHVLLVVPNGQAKESTRAVYDAFDARDGASGFEGRVAVLQRALAAVQNPRDLAGLPPNDLASSPMAAELVAQGAFRADVTGAGPAVYGLFERRGQAAEAQRRAEQSGWTALARPVA